MIVGEYDQSFGDLRLGSLEQLMINDPVPIRIVKVVSSKDGSPVGGVQFNVVDAATLRRAQADPEAHRGLIVRVAGYSDYFCDLLPALQDEIIARTEHGSAT